MLRKLSSPSKATLKHREIFEEIKKKIDSGEWEENRTIPTERDLAEYYYSSRTTIRKAIERLKQRGYLHSVHGQGTFVLPPQSREKNLLHSLTDDIRAKGGKPAQKIIEMGFTQVSDVIRKNLELDHETHSVFFIKRIRYSGSVPIGIHSSWLALDVNTEITEKELLDTGSLYTLLEQKLGLKALEATELISARLPSKQEQEYLALESNEVILNCSRVTLSVTRKPMEYVEMAYSSARYLYKTRITKDNFSV